MEAPAAIECLLLRPAHAPALARFFEDLAAAGDDGFFRPHPGDAGTLREVAEHSGSDVHLVFVEGDVVRAYGLLRGWNEDNARAIAMYERRGYEMQPDAGDPRLLVGMKPLGAAA